MSWPHLTIRIHFLTRFRIVLAGIRDLGRCPCPRCLVLLDDVTNLGTARDMKQRSTLARVDDDMRRGKVDLARDIIYKRHYLVNSKAVERILKAQSWVPTVVCEKLASIGAAN